VPKTPGVSYGGGSGWTGGGVTPSGCVSGCAQVVVVKTPTGQTIPGVIIIDGRIKTLKEFFQITIAIQNASADFNLTDMQAAIDLPAGLSPVRAGPGTNVADINTGGEVDSVSLGEIAPGTTGTGQFIIRGDAIGTHTVSVDFDGFLSGGGLSEPFPVNGSVSTSVQVYGPPELGVVVRHPSDPNGPDVSTNEIYNLQVDITNKSSRPALYTSLELFVGGDAELVDADDNPIAESSEVQSFGHIQPGQTVSATFRVKSLVEGEIIACQAIASENISLTVDTGPDGTACNIANTYPANFQPLQEDLPPTVIGINPLNGQPNIPVTSSVVATLTPRSACLTADSWANVITTPIDPNDLTKGYQVASSDFVQAGTFYLEELDDFGNPVRHIPTDLTIANPPAGGTTIATLRLGLANPASQYFLKPNTTYRATLVGGAGGVCSAASSVNLQNTFRWTFSTAQTCNELNPPVVNLVAPPDGSINTPLNQGIVLQFSNRMDPASFTFVPNDLANSSFSIVQNALESGGDISGGTPVVGNGVFSNFNRTLTFKPSANYDANATVHIRLTGVLQDTCGNPLQTPPNGVKLSSFQTIPPDTTPPSAPLVNPLPALTNLVNVQVSGQAEAGSKVSVSGGASSVNTMASAAGLFSVSAPLNLNQLNTLHVQTTDASGNASPLASVDSNGGSLEVTNDSILPTVVSITPTNGATGVSRNTAIQVSFSESIKPDTVNSLNFNLDTVAGTFTLVGDSAFTFTPNAPLDYNRTYTMSLRANGVRDLAGNGLASGFAASFTTESYPLPVITSVTPNSGVQGTIVQVNFSGSNLASASQVISGNPGISGSIVSASDDTVVANIVIGSVAATGATTLGLTTLGGNASVAFTVLHKAPVITAIVPNSGDRGATVNAQIRGSGLADITSIAIDGTGVTVTDLGTGSDTARNVRFAIDAAATIGMRTVTVTTPGGSATGTFEIISQPPPQISAIVPDSGLPGHTVVVQVNGDNLRNVTGVSVDGSGVAVIDLGSGTQTIHDLRIDIAASAAEGPRTITLSTFEGVATIQFTVITIPDALADPDGDGLINAGEFLVGTDPQYPDTNGDGILDGAEDNDGDGWPNDAEVNAGSDPLNPRSIPMISGIVAKSAAVVVARPSLGENGGVASSVFLAKPLPLTVVRPSYGESGGLAANVILAIPRPLSVLRPALEEVGGEPFNTIVGTPPVTLQQLP
jgi:hypothetical protein